MPSPKRLLPHIPTASKELPLPDDHHFDEKDPLLPTKSKLDLAIPKATYEGTKSWSTFPCSLWFETNAKVKVTCVNVNCKFEEERKWQGRIVGKGIHGSLNALLAMLEHKMKASQGRTPLIGVLTICDGCCGVLDFCDEGDHMGQVVNRISGSLVLGLLDKEVEDVVSSKVIIMEGILMDTITTVGIDGEWREWPMLRPFFKN